MAMLNYQKACAVLYESILYEYGQWNPIIYIYKYSELISSPKNR